MRILYRRGKANVLADYLSRPTNDTNIAPDVFPTQEQEERPPVASTEDIDTEQIIRPEQLNRADLQGIFEFLDHNQELATNLKSDWVRRNFTILNNKLYLIKSAPSEKFGDPLQPPGAITLLEVLEYEEILVILQKMHENLGHASVGTTIRNTTQTYWHPEMILAAYEVIRNCRSCQLMKSPDPALGNLRPIQPPPPLTMWGTDQTQVESKILLNAVE